MYRDRCWSRRWRSRAPASGCRTRRGRRAGWRRSHRAASEARGPSDAGVAAGIFSTGRYLGGIAAASLVAAFASGAGHRFGALFSVEALAALLAMLLATALPGLNAGGADPPRKRRAGLLAPDASLGEQ